jgi:hypothetical protein
MFQINSLDSLGHSSASSQRPCVAALGITEYTRLRGGASARVTRAVFTIGAVGVLGVFASPLVSNSFAEAPAVPPYSIDFEDLKPGSIDGQRGWKVEQGKAEVVADVAFAGQQCLRITPNTPFSQARLSLDVGQMPQPVMFIDFRLRPVASVLPQGGPGTDELIDVDGARIGLFRDNDSATEAQIWVFNGDGTGGGSWLNSKTPISVDAKTGCAKGWPRLSLRQDFRRQTWDLSVDGVLKVANLGFQESPINHTAAYILMGDLVQAIYLDDLFIQSENPLGNDRDQDGIPDADEASMGSNPETDDRDELVGTAGKEATFLQAFLKLQSKDGVVREALPSPIASQAPGIFAQAFTVKLMVRPGLSVRYTVDGSIPTVKSGLLLASPFELKIERTTILRAAAVDGAGVLSPVMTAAYLFPATIPAQQRPPNVSRSVQDVSRASNAPSTFTIPYGLAQEDDIPDLTPALTAAPIVVLTGSVEDFFGDAKGIYSHSSEKGPEWKRKATVQVLGKAAALRTADASMSISGSTSRYHDISLKHSFRLKFDDSGVDLTPIFGGTRFSCRDLVLRNPTHDSWTVGSAYKSNRKSAKYLADAWASKWMGENGHTTLRHQFVHVFLNDLYWGVYEAIEQEDRAFAARHEKSAEDGNVTDLLEGVPSGRVQAVFGSDEAWKTLRTAVEVASQQERRGKSADWVWVRSQINEPNLIDYMLWNCWLANSDWPQHNYLIARMGGEWNFLSWDAEFAIRRNSGVELNLMDQLVLPVDGPAYLFTELAVNPSFREAIVARMAVLTAASGGLNPEMLQRSFAPLRDSLRPLMVAESARWGGILESPRLGLPLWESSVAWVADKFIPERTAIFEKQVDRWLARQSELQAQAVANAKAGRQTPGRAGRLEIPVFVRSGIVDSDGDGLPDEWEDLYGLDISDPDDAQGDADGDGISNIDEFLLQLDPNTGNNRDSLIAKPGAQVFSKPQLRRPKEHNGRLRIEAEVR